MSTTKGAASLCNILEFLIQLWEAMVNSVESSGMPEGLSKYLFIELGDLSFILAI